jgi:ABC-type dipeptide/oligopeptide/nickel transport system ATPase component
MSRRTARAHLAARFHDVLLPDPVGHLRQFPHELSGGMKQRAMVASAMSTDPDLLIADEPTTALDVTVQREVLSIIKRMNVDSGTAVLFISHDIGVVRRLCDRVLVMKDGRIIDEIMAPSSMTFSTVSNPYTKKLLAAAPTVRLGPLQDQGQDD